MLSEHETGNQVSVRTTPRNENKYPEQTSVYLVFISDQIWDFRNKSSLFRLFHQNFDEYTTIIFMVYVRYLPWQKHLDTNHNFNETYTRPSITSSFKSLFPEVCAMDNRRPQRHVWSQDSFSIISRVGRNPYSAGTVQCIYSVWIVGESLSPCRLRRFLLFGVSELIAACSPRGLLSSVVLFYTDSNALTCVAAWSSSPTALWKQTETMFHDMVGFLMRGQKTSCVRCRHAWQDDMF